MFSYQEGAGSGTYDPERTDAQDCIRELADKTGSVVTVAETGRSSEGDQMRADVELVYFSGCPNVESARTRLREAFAELGTDADWGEWNLDERDAPRRVRGFSSPAVLVGGRHVMGDEPVESGANSCSALGAPPTAVIVAAIRDAS